MLLATFLIVTLTINPAVDRTVTVDKLVFEDRGYILDRSEAAGGRGINASLVIHGFGGRTLALVASGGEAGRKIEASLSSWGLPFRSVRVASESRTNLIISDRQGLTVKLNETGASLTQPELSEFRNVVEQQLEGAHWLMICGSMPPGVRPHFYCELIELAKGRGVKTLLDTDGDALLHALEAKPTVITPNHQEAERLLNRALITRSQLLDALERLQAMGPESVILSLGSRGALGSGSFGILEAQAPRIDALCPIGAGDAMAAAFVWSMEQNTHDGMPFADSLRWGVAAGTAKAALPGMTFPTLDQTRKYYQRVEVREVR